MKASLSHGLGISLFLTLLFGVCVGSTTWGAEPKAAVDPLACPAAPITAKATEEWRRAAVETVRRSPRSEFLRTEELSKCFGPELPECLKRLDDRQWANVASRDLYDAIFPSDAKKPPAEFLVPGKAGEEGQFVIPKDAEAIAKRKGWKVVSYKTRSSGGFDSSNALQLIFIPGSSFTPPLAYDRYIQYSLTQEANRTDPVPRLQSHFPGQIAMISMMKATPDKKARPFFQNFFPTGSDSHYKVSGSANMSFCAGCHPNGMRAISPLGYHTVPTEAPLPTETRKLVAEINDTMSSYGPIDWGHAMEPRDGKVRPFVRQLDSGPVLGQSLEDDAPTRSREFIEGKDSIAGCATRSKTLSWGSRDGQRYFTQSGNKIRWNKVRDAMACANCHNGSNRAALTNAVDSEEVKFKVLVDLSMPPGNTDLTMDERIALYSCIYAEEVKVKPDWLLEGACTVAAAAQANAICGAASGANCVPGQAVHDAGQLPPPSVPGGGASAIDRAASGAR